jgi:hypothetical protein
MKRLKGCNNHLSFTSAAQPSKKRPKTTPARESILEMLGWSCLHKSFGTLAENHSSPLFGLTTQTAFSPQVVLGGQLQANDAGAPILVIHVSIPSTHGAAPILFDDVSRGNTVS